MWRGRANEHAEWIVSGRRGLIDLCVLADVPVPLPAPRNHSSMVYSLAGTRA